MFIVCKNIPLDCFMVSWYVFMSSINWCYKEAVKYNVYEDLFMSNTDMAMNKNVLSALLNKKYHLLLLPVCGEKNVTLTQ